MSRFLIKVLLTLLPVLLVPFAFEMLVSYRLASGSRFYFQNDWHDLGGHNSDVLFIGNSRIWVQVNPFYVDSVFNTKSEVIAQDGQTIDMLWYKFNEYKKHNTTPKEIYVLADPFFWVIKNDLFGIQNFRTYFFMNRIDMSFLKHKEGYQWYYSILPMAAYDKTTYLKVLKNDTVLESYEKTRGYIPQDKPFEGEWTKPGVVRFSLDTNVVPFIDSFYTYCKQHNTKLYFIYPPISYTAYSISTGLSAFDSLVSQKNREFSYNAAFLNYNTQGLYMDSNLFYNHMHLNKNGVAVFMKQFTADTNAFTYFRKH